MNSVFSDVPKFEISTRYQSKKFNVTPMKKDAEASFFIHHFAQSTVRVVALGIRLLLALWQVELLVLSELLEL